MKIRTAIATLATLCSAAAFAAGPDYLFVDRSSETLIDAATAKSMFSEATTKRLAKLYPPNIWGFATQVEGGITSNATCVVTARVMLLPRNNPRNTKLLLFKPDKMATAFDAKPQSTDQQCRELAQAKLHEAIDALTSALAPN
jgi:hypothetical protein